MSSNSSEENQILIDSFYKSDKKPYYDPYSKPAIELTEMTKPSGVVRRSSDKLETDFGVSTLNLSKAYKPKLQSTKNKDETDDAEYENSEPDIYNFKSTGVGFSPAKNNLQKTDYKGSSISKERKESYSSNTDKYDQNSSQYTTTHYYKVKGKNMYGRKDSSSDREHASEQEWLAEQRQYTLDSESPSQALGSQYAYMYPQKQNLAKEGWANKVSAGATQNSYNQPSTTQKEKKKKKKEQPPEPNFMLGGALSQYLDTRTFYFNSEVQKQQSQQQTTSHGGSNTNPGSPQALREWFESLSVQDRVNSLTSTFSIMAHSIIEVSSKIKYPHSHVLNLYTIKKEKQPEQLDQAPMVRRRQGQPILDLNECVLERVHNQDDRLYGYNSYQYENSQAREFQTMIIKSTRITSNKQQKDTITISSEFVKNSDSFFSLLANATDDKAFSEPVYFVTRNGSGSKPVIETPKWIKRNSSHYLGIWIIALWEEALWAHFNYAKQVNIGPGVRKNDIQQLFEHRKQNLQNQEDLAKRWSDLGDEGQKKLFDKLIEESKKVTIETLIQAEQKENERRSSIYGNSLATYQADSSDGLYYQYPQNSHRFGLYTYSDVRYNHDSFYRNDDSYVYPRGSINSYTLLEQQGVHSGQPKLIYMFLPTQDGDLKEILDVSQYTSSLEMIKFLCEFPLSEINSKNYIRRHYLCDLLYKYIQDDLRQSIQEQLMNELLAIDSNSSTKNLQNNGDADEKQKKKKKTDNRKKKQKAGQTQLTQSNSTYQKKKSLSKSPSREADEDQQQQVLQEGDVGVKDFEFAQKQQQQKQVQNQIPNNKPVSNEAHHGVASTTTSDDQAYQIDQKQQQSVQKEKSPVRKTNNKQKESKKGQSQEQHSKKKPNQNQQQKKEIVSPVADQVIASQQIKALLADLVEKVCQLEDERQVSEQVAQEQQNKPDQQESDKPDISQGELLHQSVQIDNPSSGQFSPATNDPIANSESQKQAENVMAAQPKKRKRTKKKQDASEIMNNFMRKINGEDREDEVQIKNNSQSNRNKQVQQKQEQEKNQGRRQSGQTQNGQQQKSNNQQSQKIDQSKQLQQTQKPNNGRKQNDQSQKLRNEIVEKSDTKRQNDYTNDKEQQKSNKVLQSDQDKSNFDKNKNQIQHLPNQTPQQSILQVQGIKPKLLETNTYQFFQLENQKRPSSDDNNGGIFVSNFQEQPSVYQLPFSQINQDSSKSLAPFEMIDQQIQANSAKTPQLPQREAINLTAEFQKPNFNFGNILDFGIRDHIIDQSSNIYENSRVRKIDYQQPNQVAQPLLFEQESLVTVPLDWNQTSQSQTNNNIFAGFNQAALSTTSVSFTPTVQLSPQISVRSEDQFSDVNSQKISFSQRQEIEPINLSPPFTKFNSQAPPLLIPDQKMFYPQQQPFQSGYLQSQFDQPPYKYHNSNQYQQDHFNGVKSYHRGKAPFRPPQQTQFQNQKHQNVNRSPTSTLQTQDYSISQLQGSDSNQIGWNNYRNTFGGSPENFQHNYSYVQPNFNVQNMDQNQNSMISVNAPNFYPQFNQQTGNVNSDQWNQASLMPISQINHSQQILDTGFGQNNFFGQQTQILMPSEKDILFSHFEDAFYSQFDLNIQETTVKVQKSIQKFDEQRNYVLDMLQMMANKAFPGSKPVLQVFGSLMTGLALETSDMDIAVTGLRIDDRQAMIDDLHALEEEIKKWPIIKDLKAIDTASIPVIKANISMKAISKEMLKSFSEDMIDCDLPIDITFDDTPKEVTDSYRQNIQEKPYYQAQIGQNFSPPFGTDFRGNMIKTHHNPIDPIPQLFNFIVGELSHNLGATDPMTGFGMDFGNQTQAKMHQGMISCDVIKEYVRDYPCLKEVVLLLKRFLATHNLNSAYQGGISSYSTVLLVVAYMNNFSLHKSPHLTPSRLLMGFLEFYCNHFDPKIYGVNTANGGSYYVLPQTNQQQMFVIQDPVQASNNTARNSFRTPDVLNHFRSAFYSLRSLIMKEYQKHLDSEKQIKADTEQIQQVSQSSLTAQSLQVVNGSKTEKSSDGSGTRLKQAQHKKGGTQSQQETVAAKASEQQHNLVQLSSSLTAQTLSAVTQSQITSNIGRARFSIAQSFSLVNFVEKFLSQEILKFDVEQQSSGIEPRTGLGPF